MRDVPRYLRQLLHHLREAPTAPGTIARVEVRHGDECARPDGGPCTCSPQLVTRTGVEPDE